MKTTEENTLRKVSSVLKTKLHIGFYVHNFNDFF